MKVCLYYSRGPHFMRTLKQLREDHPDAAITVAVPPGFPRDPLAGLADEVVERPRPGGLGDAWRAARALRAEGYDLLVVMFDSLNLRLLAALSGARTRECHTIEGRVIRLRGGLMRRAISEALARVRGQIRYWRIRFIVRGRSVR